jgi:branched-chain amino acid transport system permease protein
MRKAAGYAALLAGAVAAPFLFPAYQAQLAFLLVMVLFAMTWDMEGGQMGYNSFGNVVFFGIGMYACILVQVGLVYPISEYTAPGGTKVFTFTDAQFLRGLALGMAAGGAAAALVAATLGWAILGLRGHYFAICTLGLGVAAGELTSGFDYVGGGKGIVPPLFPDAFGSRERFFYFVFLALTVIAFLTFRWLYRGRFGIALNAIRDDEDKAEAMGLRTTRYKVVAWCVSALFLGLMGGGVGILIGFVDPRNTAFAAGTFGVWMVLMAILGGKGTIWGPVIGAAIFHVFREFFWTYLFGWQRVALGLLIVVIVVFFPTGIVGWAKKRWPARFGRRIEPAAAE